MCAYLNAVVPVLCELGVWEVVWQAELGPDPLEVLSKRHAAEQVDLTVGKPRLHPLLQQLQNILKGNQIVALVFFVFFAEWTGQ